MRKRSLETENTAMPATNTGHLATNRGDAMKRQNPFVVAIAFMAFALVSTFNPSSALAVDDDELATLNEPAVYLHWLLERYEQGGSYYDASNPDGMMKDVREAGFPASSSDSTVQLARGKFKLFGSGAFKSFDLLVTMIDKKKVEKAHKKWLKANCKGKKGKYKCKGYKSKLKAVRAKLKEIPKSKRPSRAVYHCEAATAPRGKKKIRRPLTKQDQILEAAAICLDAISPKAGGYNPYAVPRNLIGARISVPAELIGNDDDEMADVEVTDISDDGKTVTVVDRNGDEHELALKDIEEDWKVTLPEKVDPALIGETVEVKLASADSVSSDDDDDEDEDDEDDDDEDEDDDDGDDDDDEDADDDDEDEDSEESDSSETKVDRVVVGNLDEINYDDEDSPGKQTSIVVDGETHDIGVVISATKYVLLPRWMKLTADGVFGSDMAETNGNLNTMAGGVAVGADFQPELGRLVLSIGPRIGFIVGGGNNFYRKGKKTEARFLAAIEGRAGYKVHRLFTPYLNVRSFFSPGLGVHVGLGNEFQFTEEFSLVVGAGYTYLPLGIEGGISGSVIPMPEAVINGFGISVGGRFGGI